MDRLQFHHNRYSLLLFAFLLSFTRCDQSLSLAAPPGPRMESPLWAVRLMQMQVSLMVLASGGSKLLDRDWRNNASTACTPSPFVSWRRGSQTIASSGTRA